MRRSTFHAGSARKMACCACCRANLSRSFVRASVELTSGSSYMGSTTSTGATALSTLSRKRVTVSTASRVATDAACDALGVHAGSLCAAVGPMLQGKALPARTADHTLCMKRTCACWTGTGSVCSPHLYNIYLHYVVGVWWCPGFRSVGLIGSDVMSTSSARLIGWVM